MALCILRTSKGHLSTIWLWWMGNNGKVFLKLRFTHWLQFPGSQASNSMFLVLGVSSGVQTQRQTLYRWVIILLTLYLKGDHSQFSMGPLTFGPVPPVYLRQWPYSIPLAPNNLNFPLTTAKESFYFFHPCVNDFQNFSHLGQPLKQQWT